MSTITFTVICLNDQRRHKRALAKIMFGRSVCANTTVSQPCQCLDLLVVGLRSPNSCKRSTRRGRTGSGPSQSTTGFESVVATATCACATWPWRPHASTFSLSQLKQTTLPLLTRGSSSPCYCPCWGFQREVRNGHNKMNGILFGVPIGKTLAATVQLLRALARAESF